MNTNSMGDGVATGVAPNVVVLQNIKLKRLKDGMILSKLSRVPNKLKPTVKTYLVDTQDKTRNFASTSSVAKDRPISSKLTITNKQLKVAKLSPYTLKSKRFQQYRNTEDASSTSSKTKDPLNCPPSSESTTEEQPTVPKLPPYTQKSKRFKKYKKVKLFTEPTGPEWHKVSNKIVTKPIIASNLPKVFEEFPIFGQPKNTATLKKFQDKGFQEFVGLSDEDYAKELAFCSPNHLLTGREMEMESQRPAPGILSSAVALREEEQDIVEIPENAKLNTLKKLQTRITCDINQMFPRKLKYRGIRLLTLQNQNNAAKPKPKKTIEEHNKPPDLEPGKDLLYRVRVYRPFVCSRQDGINNVRGRHSVFNCDVMVAGRQLLTALRDRIVCRNDLDLRLDMSEHPNLPPPASSKVRGRHSVFNCDVMVAGRQLLTALRDRIGCRNDLDLRLDMSEHPNLPPPASSKESFPSNFMFINNVFYVDTRAGCHDISAVLRHFAEQRGLGQFPVRDMASTTLDEIHVRLAHPEVYFHQGNCEHIFQFSEIRLLNITDPLHLSAYPCHTAVSQNQMLYCNNCGEFAARWIVTHSERVPFDPAFFCETCFHSYMYIDGKKVENFKAYLYKGNEINMLRPNLDDLSDSDPQVVQSEVFIHY